MLIERSTTAPTRLVKTPLETYAYRRFGAGTGPPLLCLQHFMGTLDNWDPAVVDALASERDVVLFESARIGRSTGSYRNRFRKWRNTRLHSSQRSVSRASTCCVFSLAMGHAWALVVAIVGNRLATAGTCTQSWTE